MTIGDYIFKHDVYDEISEGIYACEEIVIRKNGVRIWDEDFCSKVEELYDSILDEDELKSRLQEEINWYEYKNQL